LWRFLRVSQKQQDVFVPIFLGFRNTCSLQPAVKSNAPGL